MLIVDTGVLVAAADRTDPHHSRCASIVCDDPGPLLTTAMVIAEIAYLLERELGTHFRLVRPQHRMSLEEPLPQKRFRLFQPSQMSACPSAHWIRSRGLHAEECTELRKNGSRARPWRQPMGAYHTSMTKMTVYLPDDLAEKVRSSDVNVSAVLQEALRERLAVQPLKDWLVTRPRPERPSVVESGRGAAAVKAAREEFGT